MRRRDSREGRAGPRKRGTRVLLEHGYNSLIACNIKLQECCDSIAIFFRIGPVQSKHYKLHNSNS